MKITLNQRLYVVKINPLPLSTNPMLSIKLKNDSVSFKAKVIKELKGNDKTDNFSGSAYRGSGNSRAKFVDA